MESIFDSRFFNSNLFYPRRDTAIPPRDAHDTWVSVDPNTRLHVRYFSGLDASLPLLLFHGNGEIVSDYDTLAHSFRACGTRLIVAEFRGYGRSEGSPTLRSMLRDAVTVFDSVQQTLQTQRRDASLAVLGRSLGSLCAAQIAHDRPTQVKGLVFDSAIGDALGILRRRGILPPDTLDEQDRVDFSPLHKLSRCVAPALFIHGEDDGIIPRSECETLAATCTSRHKRIEILSQRGHNDLFSDARYWTILESFVSSLLS